MARSLKKWFYVHEKLDKKIKKLIWWGEKKMIKTRARSSQIIPDMIGLTIAVHNGKQFVTVYLTEDMLWHRLWEFSFTRTFRGHPF